MSYQCEICGQIHDGLPDIGFQWPDPWFAIPESEREVRIRASADLCVIDDEAYYIRGTILIPIRDHDHSFGIGVWVSQKRENFQTYVQNLDSSDIGPFFGWLSNRLPFYERDTWALKTMARFQGKNQRPLIDIEPSDHPLYTDFSTGVSLDQAWRYVHWNSGS